MQLRELAKDVSIKINGDARLPLEKQDDWQRRSFGYSCTLAYKRRKMKLDFFMGQANPSPPTSYDVLECLLSDASSIENARSFEEWASELGMDPDSRKVEKTYRASVRQTEKLRALLGDDYEVFFSAEGD